MYDVHWHTDDGAVDINGPLLQGLFYGTVQSHPLNPQRMKNPRFSDRGGIQRATVCASVEAHKPWLRCFDSFSLSLMEVRLGSQRKSGGSALWHDHSSIRDMAICSGVMGSSRNHLPVAR